MVRPGKRTLGFFAVLVTLVAGTARGQSINTYAGGGPVGDGRPATEATLSSPAWVVAAPDGDLYISGPYNNLIRRVDGESGIRQRAPGAPARSDRV